MMRKKAFYYIFSLILGLSLPLGAYAQDELFPVDERFSSEEVFFSSGDGSVSATGHGWGEESSPQEIFAPVEEEPLPEPTRVPEQIPQELPAEIQEPVEVLPQEPVREDTPTPIPTSTPIPTPVPTKRPRPTATPLPTETPVPEDTPAAPAETVEMAPLDTPRVQYQGTVSMGDYFGLTREEVISYLESNRDSFLGTPYATRGEAPIPGQHMQCTGFVWLVLDACLSQNREMLPCSEVQEGRAGAAPTWSDFFSQVEGEGGNILSYEFDTKEKLLSSGLAKKGDIIWSYTKDPAWENHVGFFWGDDSADDIFWSSSGYYDSETILPQGDYKRFATYVFYGEEGINRISKVEACAPDKSITSWRLIPLEMIQQEKKSKGFFESLMDFLFGWLD